MAIEPQNLSNGESSPEQRKARKRRSDAGKRKGVNHNAAAAALSTVLIALTDLSDIDKMRVLDAARTFSRLTESEDNG